MRLVIGMFYLGLICKMPASGEEPYIYSQRTITNGDASIDSFAQSQASVCLADTWKPIEPSICYQPPTITSPKQEDLISTFNRTFFKEIRSRKVLRDHSYFRLSSCQSEEYFFDIARYMLDHAGVTDDCLSGIVAKSVATVGTLGSDFYIQSASNTVSKLLLSEGVLQSDNVVGLAKSYVDMMERNAGRVGLRDPQTFIQTVGTTCVEFVDAIGLDFTRYYNSIYVLFMREYDPDETCACFYD